MSGAFKTQYSPGPGLRSRS